MACALTKRCVFLSFTAMVGILTMLIITFNPLKNSYNHKQLMFLRQGIANELNAIELEVEKLLVQKRAPSARLAQRLGEIVNRLDDRLQPASINSETVGYDGSVDVCPEEFKEGTSREAVGWTITSCTNAKPISSVISVLINTVTYPSKDENNIEKVLKGITETYPTVKVYLATRSDQVVEAAKRYNNIDAFKVYNTKLGKSWNTLIRKVSTPYVLVARDVFHFTWLTQLERQIRVVSQIPNVGVAGGSYRNFSGHWKAGCVQTTMKNYVLEYQEGYYHSRNECMFCDYLQGPFVAKTKLLKFDESLPNQIIFEDWFLRAAADGNLVMSCPDAMYFTTDYSSFSKKTDKSVWKPLAKKWELNRVLLPEGVKHSFSCKDIGFRCKANNELLPVCCLEEYADAMSFFQTFADNHNITFELDTGSVLGSVKFSGLLPWDLDGDLSLLSSDVAIFGKKETVEHFQRNGFELTKFKLSEGGYFKINFNRFYIEVWGSSTVSNIKYLPPELQQHARFTKTNIRGKWIDTPCSPGLYARNRYGKEILKHSQSWMKWGLPHSFSDYVTAGSFAPCKRSNHHSCLQFFPADGDIPFLVT